MNINNNKWKLITKTKTLANITCVRTSIKRGGGASVRSAVHNKRRAARIINKATRLQDYWAEGNGDEVVSLYDKTKLQAKYMH